MIQNDMKQNDSKQNGTIRYDPIWYDAMLMIHFQDSQMAVKGQQ